MATTKQEITTIVHLFRTLCAKDMSDIESLSTGSYYKTKDDILNSATKQARSAKRFIYLISSCVDYINEGGKFKDWIDLRLDVINNTNQFEQDRVDALEDLKRLSEIQFEV